MDVKRKSKVKMLILLGVAIIIVVVLTSFLINTPKTNAAETHDYQIPDTTLKMSVSSEVLDFVQFFWAESAQMCPTKTRWGILRDNTRVAAFCLDFHLDSPTDGSNLDLDQNGTTNANNEQYRAGYLYLIRKWQEIKDQIPQYNGQAVYDINQIRSLGNYYDEYCAVTMSYSNISIETVNYSLFNFALWWFQDLMKGCDRETGISTSGQICQLSPNMTSRNGSVRELAVPNVTREYIYALAQEAYQVANNSGSEAEKYNKLVLTIAADSTVLDYYPGTPNYYRSAPLQVNASAALGITGTYLAGDGLILDLALQNAPNGSYIVDELGQRLTAIHLNQRFYVMVPVDSMTDIKADFNIIATTNNYVHGISTAYLPTGQLDTVQPVLPAIVYGTPTTVQTSKTFSVIGNRLSVSKVDEGGNYLSGATLQLLKGTEVIAEWLTANENPKVFENLEPGTYTVKEIIPAAGYTTTADQTITIPAATSTSSQTDFMVTMRDETTDICIQKVDAADGITPVVGATLQLIDGSGSVVQTWTTTESPQCFTHIPIGTYRLVEIEAPTEDGYVISPEQEIVIENIPAVQNFTMEDDYTKICIQKIDPDSKEFIAGAHLVLTGPDGYRQDIITTAEEDSYCFDHIPVGTYHLEEIETPSGYVTSPTLTFDVSDGTLKTIVMNDLKTNVQVLKLDADTGKALEGAELAIIDSEGKEVASWTSEKEAYEIQGLPIGKYTLIEKKAPEGYEKFEDYSFEIEDKNETVMINAKDTVIVEVPNTMQPANIVVLVIGSILLISGGIILYVMFVRNKQK